jgi:hypothetical protein
MDRFETQAKEAVDTINNICGPEKMTRAEAKEFLDTVMSLLQAEIDALEDDILGGEPEEEI